VVGNIACFDHRAGNGELLNEVRNTERCYHAGELSRETKLGKLEKRSSRAEL
jgi:hypothetical protein